MNSAPESPLMDHLIELRTRLIWCLAFFLVAFGVSYPFSETLLQVLVYPLIKASGDHHRKLIYTGLTEAFVTYLKISFFTATFVSLPMIGVQIWRFVAPGLYAMEKRILLPFLIVTPILFFLGGAFAYFVVLPPFFEFCLHFETHSFGGMQLALEAKIDQYLSTVMQVILAFGVGFELPVIIVLLGRMGVLTADFLKTNRKYAFVIISAASAILTPPDLLSMISLMIPLYALYELSIFFVKVQEDKTPPEDPQ